MIRLLAFLKGVPATAYLVVAGAGLVIGGYQYWAHVQQEYGKKDILIAQGEQANAVLRHAQDSLAKQYRVDTVYFHVTKTRVDTLTNTVESWKHDTLKVVEYVAKADTTIKACTQALQTCEQRVGVAQKGWDGARAENAILKKLVPSPAKPWVDRAIGGVVVGAIVWFAKK